MDDIPQELVGAAKEVEAGDTPRTSVRGLLSWFGAERRRFRVVSRIREALDELGLTTFPDFEGEWIDAPIYLTHKSNPMVAQNSSGEVKSSDDGKVVEESSTAKLEPPAKADGAPISPSHRLGRLKAAHAAVVSIAPSAPIQQAITLMLAHDFSQLPVMQGDRDVKGLVTWKGIGSRIALKQKCDLVKDGMESHRELSEDDSIFAAVNEIARYDCVLVRSKDKRITGVITASDIANQFHLLTEPFLLLADIENRVRNLISSRFQPADFQALTDPSDPLRKINNVHDMSFGGYVFMLQKPEMWAKLNLNLDRATFCEQLDGVREIRNDVMHFDPDGIDGNDLDTLRRFAGFMERMEALAAC